MSDNPAEILLKRMVATLARKHDLKACDEYRVIEGRRYRVDVAIPEILACFECDGWQYHARHKDAWKKEKKRDRDITLAGWRTYRFAASEILKDGGIYDEIDLIIRTEKARRGAG